jgi:hypothetical protein
MAFTLVYTADHFVFDIITGWTYAIIVYSGFSWYWRRHHSEVGQPSMSRPLRKSS